MVWLRRTSASHSISPPTGGMSALLIYSNLKATIGSTFVARRAGM